MALDIADLDYLRGKAEEYRRHARTFGASKRAECLLEIARQYETRLEALETRSTRPSPRRVVGNGRG